MTGSTGARYTEISWTARKIVPVADQQVRPGPYLTQWYEGQQHESDQTEHERDQQYPVEGGGELEGYGVVGPGEDGEGQQGAEQHHVDQLQPLRSETGAERSAQQAVLEPVVSGRDDPAEPDDRRQDEHQNPDRQ